MSPIHFRKLPVYLLLTVFLASSALSQDDGSATLSIPDGTPLKLRLAESVSSAHAHVGDPLLFVVVRDVSVGGYTVIPAGTLASGSITGVKRHRLLGMGGQVSLKLDSVELVNGQRVELQARKRVKGSSRTKLMVGAMIATSLIFLPATPVFLLTRGHDSTVVKSTEITAQIEGARPILAAGLQHAPQSPSGLEAMMGYLPPRVFSGDGQEGDMVNLVFVAQPADLQEAFARAGWVQTDSWKPSFVWHLARHGTCDARLPMARFYLFGRVQDYSYALPDPGAVVSRRHHIRIWKTDYTVDGTPIWTGAATHDVAIEIAKRGRLINHTIDPAVDDERDFIGADLTSNASVSRQEYLQGVDPVFEAETASGAPYHSDSRILVLTLQQSMQAKAGASGESAASASATALPIGITAEPSQSGFTRTR